MNIEISKLSMTDVESRPSTMSTQFKRDYSEGAASYVPVVLRILELIISIVCIGLIDDPFVNSRLRIFLEPRTAALAYSTFSAFIIICSVAILGKCVKETFPWKSASLLSLVGTILYISCAIAIISDWSEAKTRQFWPPNTQRLDFMIVTGGLSICGAIVFLIDFLFSVQQGVRGNFD